MTVTKNEGKKRSRLPLVTVVAISILACVVPTYWAKRAQHAVIQAAQPVEVPAWTKEKPKPKVEASLPQPKVEKKPIGVSGELPPATQPKTIDHPDFQWEAQHARNLISEGAQELSDGRAMQALATLTSAIESLGRLAQEPDFVMDSKFKKTMSMAYCGHALALGKANPTVNSAREAMSELRTALRWDPSNELAREALSKIQSALAEQ